MSNKHLFDQIIEEIKNDPMPEAHMEQARRRTMEKMSQKPSDTALTAADVKSISGCDDFQTLIPAYIKNELSEARMILVGDHTRSCVPCRRHLQAVKELKNVENRRRKLAPTATGGLSLVWKVAAVFIFLSLAGLGYKTFTLSSWFKTKADIQIMDGSLYTLSNHQLVLKEESSLLSYGDEFRAPRDSNAMLGLPDGTQIELARRSIFKMEQSDQGTTLNLLAGKAIIEAADQGDKHLFVSTPDCLVTVKGTVFSVNSGPKGSRVSVLDGEVQVQKGKTTSVLLPGNQFTSEENLKRVPLSREVAWSTAPSRLEPFLTSVRAAAKQLESTLADEGTRYQSALLPLMPSNTSIYGAIPNIGVPAMEIFETIQKQLNLYPEIKQAMVQKNMGDFNEDIQHAVQLLGELSSYFGNELAFGVACEGPGNFKAPLFLTESSGKPGLEDFIRDELTNLAVNIEDESPLDHLVFVENPQATAPANDKLFIWNHNGYIAASPEIGVLQELQGYIGAGQNPGFTNSSFFKTLDELYETGLSIVFGLDFSEMINQKGDQILVDSGIADLDNFIFLKRDALLDTSFEASLTFKDIRKGMAGWLAEPAPLESLTFLSPDVTIFASISLIDPEFMLNDLMLTMKDQSKLKGLMDAGEEEIISIIHDLAVALGGEVTLAIDGPILPFPQWKVIAELYDSTLLQETVDQIVMLSNQHNDFNLVRTTSDFNGLEVNEIRSQTYNWSFYYTVVDGYMLAVPNLSLLDQTVKNRNFNLSIASSEKFANLLPANSYNEFSFLFYQNSPEIFEAVSKLVQSTQNQKTQGQKQVHASLAPKMIYGYAEQQRISFASTGGDSLLNMLVLQLVDPNSQKINLFEQLLQTPDVE